MARPAKGKPLTMRTVRLDDDVWAECQRLGKEHGTINEGIAAAHALRRAVERALRRFDNEDTGGLKTRDGLAWAMAQDLREVLGPQRRKRGPRPKGDKTR